MSEELKPTLRKWLLLLLVMATQSYSLSLCIYFTFLEKAEGCSLKVLYLMP